MSLGYESISLFFQYTTEFHTSLHGFTSFRDVALKFFWFERRQMCID